MMEKVVTDKWVAFNMSKPSIREKSIKIRVTSKELLQLKGKAGGKPLAPFMREFCISAKIPKSSNKIPVVVN